MKKDDETIINLFRNLAGAWNNGDSQLYSSYFTEDCDYITFEGQHLKGRKENAEFHKELFNGILKGSNLSAQIKGVRFLTPDIVIAHQVGAVRLRFQRKISNKRLSINTNLLVRVNEDWKIAGFHNSRIKRPSAVFRIIQFFLKR